MFRALWVLRVVPEKWQPVELNPQVWCYPSRDKLRHGTLMTSASFYEVAGQNDACQYVLSLHVLCGTKKWHISTKTEAATEFSFWKKCHYCPFSRDSAQCVCRWCFFSIFFMYCTDQAKKMATMMAVQLDLSVAAMVACNEKSDIHCLLVYFFWLWN